ncbi:hypothetical protein I317_01015 [Kwoniella heveanensis CBS 569]|nr:hypothetical protein I317_01015 [Kwoniella heveanensis CBS 569]
MSFSSAEPDNKVIDVDAPKRHDVHRDPRNRVIIISSDNVEFRASHFHLCRVSSFFEGLLTTAGPASVTSPTGAAGDDSVDDKDIEPIHLDYPAPVIALFLDAAGSSWPSFPAIDMTTAKDLLELTEFTMCDKLKHEARYSLIRAGMDLPLELLVIAADRNDIALAQSALQKLDSNTIETKLYRSTGNTPRAFKRYLERLSPSFRLELYSQLMLGRDITSSPSKSTQTPGIYLRSDWSSIADRFNPARTDTT